MFKFFFSAIIIDVVAKARADLEDQIIEHEEQVANRSIVTFLPPVPRTDHEKTGFDWHTKKKSSLMSSSTVEPANNFTPPTNRPPRKLSPIIPKKFQK